MHVLMKYEDVVKIFSANIEKSLLSVFLDVTLFLNMISKPVL